MIIICHLIPIENWIVNNLIIKYYYVKKNSITIVDEIKSNDHDVVVVVI